TEFTVECFGGENCEVNQTHSVRGTQGKLTVNATKLFSVLSRQSSSRKPFGTISATSLSS
ncbi:MAG: hypothetical protein ABL921_18665, partial [Pirellula sp.]